IELDPQFAMAYARLSAAYNNTLQLDLATQAAAKAYELRARTTEHERFYIEQKYFDRVTGDLEEASAVCRLWAHRYPRDFRAHAMLALAVASLGMFDQALPEARQAMSLDPKGAAPYDLAAIALIGLNRGDEARAVIEKALASGLDSPYFHQKLLQIAAAESDQGSIEKEMAWAQKNHLGYTGLYAHGILAFSRGQPAEAERDFRKAV